MNCLASNYDRAVFYSTLGRSASLRYRYAKARRAFDEADNILKGLRRRSGKVSALEAFFAHNYGVFLGYTGRIDSHQKYVQRAETIYRKLEADQDFIHLNLNKMDVSMYSSLKGYTYLENRMNTLRERLKNAYHREKGFDLRLGVLNYLIYLKTGNRKRLEKSNSFFNKTIYNTESLNWRSYWARCGRIVTAHHLGQEHTGSLGQAPPGGIAYANRFPPIILLLVECDRILGNYNRAWERLRKFDAHISLMLAQFPRDEHYKRFILQNFALIVEKRIQVALEEENWTNEQKMNRIIRANEIQQNRLLQLKTKLSTGLPLETNVSRLIRRMAPSDDKTGLVYVTGEFSHNGKRKALLMIKPDITRGYASILPIELDRVNDIMRKLLIAKSGGEHKRLLSQLGKLFPSLKDILMCNEVKIVPNSSFLQIPFHMIRVDGKYLFEYTKVSYWPSLNLAASAGIQKKVNKDPRLCIFHTSEDKMGIKEAEEIKTLFPKTVIVPDPSENDIIERSRTADMVHVIAHHRNGKVHFRDKAYDADKFLDSLKGHKSLVVMHVCGSRVRNVSGPPIAHDSIAHYLLGKGHDTVIAHNWDLAQEVSIKFSKGFYTSLLHKDNIPVAFQKALMSMKNFNPIKFGGYMLWGNGTSMYQKI